MPKRLRISVALCTFNGERFLEPQLRSLAEQTRRPDEIVVQDDQSTDGTAGVVERFATRSGIDVRFEQNAERRGIHGNFAAAFARCTGDVILPCDQDDFWRPTKLEKTVAPIERDEHVTFAIAESEIGDAGLQPTGVTVFDKQAFGRSLRNLVAAGDGLRAFLRHNVAPGHAIAFRATVLKALLPMPTTCVYDQWLALIACGLGRSALVRERLSIYRTHASQSVGGREHSLLDRAAGQSKLKLDHLQRQLDTHELLLERLSAAGAAEESIRLVRSKVRFLRTRLAMREGRLRRYGLTAKLALRGDYWRMGRGLLTLGRDLYGKS